MKEETYIVLNEEGIRFRQNDKTFSLKEIIDLQTENTKLKQDKQELIEWLEGKINRISGTTSHTYTDSLGKTVIVNRLIQGAYEDILEKLGE